MSFDDAFAAVLAAEGGTSNDPDDAGGLTHAGITRVTAVAAHARGLVSTDDPQGWWDRMVSSGVMAMAGAAVGGIVAGLIGKLF